MSKTLQSAEAEFSTREWDVTWRGSCADGVVCAQPSFAHSLKMLASEPFALATGRSVVRSACVNRGSR